MKCHDERDTAYESNTADEPDAADWTVDLWADLQWHQPDAIEGRSMAIIRSELGGRTFDPDEEPVILRAIHTSADFEYADQLAFTPGVVPAAVEAIRAGAHIVTDTRMAWSGISRQTLAKFGGEAHCFMSDADVAAEAKAKGCTRASVCMDRGIRLRRKLGKPVIFAVGNAPTALIRLAEWMANTDFRPDLVVGAPVGFVNVVEAKNLILAADCPSIVARGRKGGSNIAAAICNALLYRAAERTLHV